MSMHIKNSSAVLVTASIKSMSICNRLQAKLVDINKNGSF